MYRLRGRGEDSWVDIYPLKENESAHALVKRFERIGF
jgi:hypothetical protein